MPQSDLSDLSDESDSKSSCGYKSGEMDTLHNLEGKDCKMMAGLDGAHYIHG
jgi:hypothetical protein